MGHNKTNPRWLHTVVDSVYSGRGADDGYRTANIKKKKKSAARSDGMEPKYS